MTAAPVPDGFAAAAMRRPALRPLALPTEHGGWGFLLEPLVLGLLVAPSWSGTLIALAAIFAFLTRQPLKLALVDTLRRKTYPRTLYCWMFAASFALAAALSISAAVAVSGIAILIPFGLVAPLAVVTILYDANNRSRSLVPEICGAAAMSSTAVAIGIAGGMRLVPAFALAGIIVARGIPAIAYVRTLITRTHGKQASPWPAITLHAAALAAVAAFAPRLAVAAIAILLVRSLWFLNQPPPPARILGWREIAFGTLTVVLSATGFYL